MRVRDAQADCPKLTAAGTALGFLLADSFLNPLYINAEAVRILTYPDGHGSTQSVDKILSKRVQSLFRKRGSNSQSSFVMQIKSGRRCYLCRLFPVSSVPRAGRGLITGLLIERGSGTVNLLQMAEDFRLTEREREVVQLLAQGLTSKEIADRMAISPNTVKAFLRLVMIKTGVTTRSGILGRILQNGHPSNHLKQSKPG